MKEKDHNTEQHILNSARNVFIRKGYHGARMQEIADEAGMNKALVHYYFRSKEKLFRQIFIGVFVQFFPKMGDVLTDKTLPLMGKIEFFIHNYIDLLAENSFIASFIIMEINRDPDETINLIQEISGGMQEKYFADFKASLDKAVEQGEVIPVDFRQLIVNIISLCVFPFIGRPLVRFLMFDNDNAAFEAFLKTRKQEVVHFIKSAITPAS